MKIILKFGKYICLLLAVASICLFIFIILPWYKDSKNTGTNIGAISGSLAGKAVGSYKGITEGRKAGYDSGKLEGLSAKDTEAQVTTTLEQAGSIEVMEVELELDNASQIGKQDAGYVALYKTNGTAVFTVDVMNSKVEFVDSKTIRIIAPEPVMSLYLDKDEKLGDYKKFFSRVDGAEAAEAYFNSNNWTITKVKETLENYDEIADEAKKAAETRIRQLCDYSSVDSRNVIVEFVKMETEDEKE